VVVQPGDSFWRLAERHEAERLGRRPTENETGACWQQLVALNRARLAVPDDPDLLFPGQVVVVPCR
jgi:nucleoid-associated protein YgaU